MTQPLRLYTIGHSTRSIEELLELLHAYQIKQLVHVRTIPKSYRVPWFNSDSLKTSFSARKNSLFAYETY